MGRVANHVERKSIIGLNHTKRMETHLGLMLGACVLLYTVDMGHKVIYIGIVLGMGEEILLCILNYVHSRCIH